MSAPLATYAAVMGGGALGSGLRLCLSTLVDTRVGGTFPAGTLLVNVSGCLIVGLFAALTGPDGPWVVPPVARQFVMIGVLGGYTTFSSFSLQTLELVSRGEWFRAGLYLALSVVLCLAGVWLGHTLGGALTPR